MDKDNCYTSVPNQRQLTTHKDKANRQNIYTVTNIDSLSYAARVLTHSGLKLWLYLAKNQDKFTFWLSPIDVRACTGLSIASYRRAFSELKEKKFLVQSKKNCFDFYETPVVNTLSD